jgi:hypothetical protein
LSVDTVIIDLETWSKGVGVVDKRSVTDAAVRTDTITSKAMDRIKQYRPGKSPNVEFLSPVRLGASKSTVIPQCLLVRPDE